MAQSLNRAIKRGNAAIYWNTSKQTPEILWKKGSTKAQWHYAKQRMLIDQTMYDQMRESIEDQSTKPEGDS